LREGVEDPSDQLGVLSGLRTGYGSSPTAR
jgi:hypothetical protein